MHSFAVHPGVVYTDLARHMTRDDFSEGGTLANLDVTDVAHGAATTVWAATSPELDGLGGCYLEDCHIANPAADGTRGWLRGLGRRPRTGGPAVGLVAATGRTYFG